MGAVLAEGARGADREGRAGHRSPRSTRRHDALDRTLGRGGCMIWHRNYSGPDPLEHARMERIMSLSCIVCALYGDITPRRLECHHIVRGNKRLGHWYTIPLCVGHHRGVDWTDQAVQISIASGSRAFREAHGYDD